MKKVAVLTLIATLNLGGAAGELIFSDGFESGWPNAWAATVGWSAFVVNDSTGALVGPVVGFWTNDNQTIGESGIPQVAVLSDGEKVVFKAETEVLSLGRKVYFEDTDCTGQAYFCVVGCLHEGTGYRLAMMQGRAHGIGPGNVLYRAEPPHADGQTHSSWSHEELNTQFCNNTPSPDTPLTGTIWFAAPVLELDTLFTPPFTVE